MPCLRTRHRSACYNPSKLAVVALLLLVPCRYLEVLSLPKKVLLRVCGKCVDRRGNGFDPRVAIREELERRGESDVTIEVESGSCMGPCASGPNIQLLNEIEPGWPRVAVVEGMSRREKTYRCILEVKERSDCSRACDLAYRLATEGPRREESRIHADNELQTDLQTESAHEQRAAQADEELQTDLETESERKLKIVKELQESRAYLAQREASVGAANWREKMR
eukprot:TRINITY_DN109527_c0_g1_i1.p1 TRINITY_DN109527_c0_g1~~TRINITY_DN109527_c0_g1_i1.p1  ORF type:complete len:224 (+),score=25.85 TRINITY_DN109527_c0_g1_i1:145-816(+)